MDGGEVVLKWCIIQALGKSYEESVCLPSSILLQGVLTVIEKDTH